MSEMLQKQQDVEIRPVPILVHKLLLEIARRRRFREGVEKVVEGMMAELETMSSEERQLRDDFNAEHGAHIPADICLCIENPPTRWEVIPWAGDIREVLPEIDADLLAQARKKLKVPVTAEDVIAVGMPVGDSL
ncbi:hypothetical protein JVU11DRAFT_3941 [Chiua virens]|nr:hypothetical protein JVU11DRAFT_3941 [Chiua virens]